MVTGVPDGEQDVLAFNVLRSRRRRLMWVVLVPVALLLARATVFGGTDLLSQIPPVIKVSGWIAGAILGCAVAWQGLVIRDQSGKMTGKDIFGMIALVPMAVLITAELTRWAFEAAAFTSAKGTVYSRDIKISNVSSGKSGTKVYLKLGHDGREIRVPVTYQRYLELAAIRPPLWSLSYFEEPYCVTLPVEKGHWGAIRAHIPKVWETGLNEYHPCGIEPPIL